MFPLSVAPIRGLRSHQHADQVADAFADVRRIPHDVRLSGIDRPPLIRQEHIEIVIIVADDRGCVLRERKVPQNDPDALRFPRTNIADIDMRAVHKDADAVSEYGQKRLPYLQRPLGAREGGIIVMPRLSVAF